MRLTSPVLVLVLLAMAACGDGKDTFTPAYNRAVRPVVELGGNPGEHPKDYMRLARRVQRASRNLAHLSPPEGASDELARVRTQLDRVASRLRAVASAQRQRDAKAQVAAARSLRKTNRDFEKAERALQRAVAG